MGSGREEVKRSTREDTQEVPSKENPKEEEKGSRACGTITHCRQETGTKASAISVVTWATNGENAKNSGFNRCRSKVPKDGKQ